MNSLQDLQDQRAALDQKFGRIMREDPSSAELAVIRRQRMKLSGKIAAAKGGYPFEDATPEQIAAAVIPNQPGRR